MALVLPRGCPRMLGCISKTRSLNRSLQQSRGARDNVNGIRARFPRISPRAGLGWGKQSTGRGSLANYIPDGNENRRWTPTALVGTSHLFPGRCEPMGQGPVPTLCCDDHCFPRSWHAFRGLLRRRFLELEALGVILPHLRFIDVFWKLANLRHSVKACQLSSCFAFPDRPAALVRSFMSTPCIFPRSCFSR